jgi:hypothetical protein
VDNYLPTDPHWVDSCDVSDNFSEHRFAGGRKQFIKTAPKPTRTYKLRWNVIDLETTNALRQFHDDHGPAIPWLINLWGYDEAVLVRFVRDTFKETWGSGSRDFWCDVECRIETVV